MRTPTASIALLCAVLLTAGATARAETATPVPVPSCVSQTHDKLTPAQQRRQLRETWRRHCALADAEKADDMLPMDNVDRPEDEQLKLLDAILNGNRAVSSSEGNLIDGWTAPTHGAVDANLWLRPGGPGSVASHASPRYQYSARAWHLEPGGVAGSAIPAVPEPAQAGMLLAGLALLAAGAYRRRQTLSADTAPPAARR